ncbi:MAG: hypothetical protein Q9223_005759 [Gallowayella weberi]
MSITHSRSSALFHQLDIASMSPDFKAEFLVSTYTASQFYQPAPPKWLKMKTYLPKNLDRPARESLKSLEILADIRSKLNTFENTEQIDILIDQKINLNAQFTPRNSFDCPEDFQLDRLSRLTEVRRRLETTQYGLANLDAVLKISLDNLLMTTGISRAHSVPLSVPRPPSPSLTKLTQFLTAHQAISSIHTTDFILRTPNLTLFFNDRTRHLHLYQSSKPFIWEGHPITLNLRDVWRATWAEHSAKVCLHLLDTHTRGAGLGGGIYESCMVEMCGFGDARGFLMKMSGVANFRMERLER